ncbi:D-2-hydroxyacid dehydrogenase [Ornithinibacillus californiensis]|uniref:D-2-hydroxyacid dehydrogenase n=1 Tax=Ornithinibacillus californiensis TaxID=161536 RepID=UPI00064DF835|nr:D-2-hydroxyacid dehydrogenase [Ornithinibacillus californiensis]
MVILFSATISEKHRQSLVQKYPTLDFIFTSGIKEAEQHLEEATVFVTYGDDLDESTIEKAINLKWIMVLSAGVDQLPFKQIEKRGILVTNSRGIHKTQMAEYTISMMLQVYRQEKTLYENEKLSKWDKSVRMKEITAHTLLVLGTGDIGQEVARLAKVFQMNTVGLSRSGRPVEYFDEVYTIETIKQNLPKADFIVSVLPSTAETKYFLSDEHFNLMKEEAVFINIGRGDLVKTETILQAVRDQQIAHAVLDVFEVEPLPEDSPLWTEPNITVTPHISGQSPNYMIRALTIFQENLDKYLNGENNYTNTVEPSRGY